jgi:hypothetical protein
VALILTVKTVYLRRQRTCKGRILTIFNIHMKDNQMQRPMPSKPALKVKVILQLPSMCPASRTNTTVDILFMSRKELQQQLVKRTRVGINSSWKAYLMRRRIR